MVDEGSILAAGDARLEPGEIGYQTKFTIRNNANDVSRLITIAHRSRSPVMPDANEVRAAVNALMTEGILMVNGTVANSLTGARNVTTDELI